MLATRPEMQLSGDWMLVPGARNLHWRYTVLHSAFLECKQKIAPGDTLNANLDKLIEAAKRVWERMQKNIVVIGGVKKPLNGNMGMLMSADDIDISEKTLLRAYLNTTRNIGSTT